MKKTKSLMRQGTSSDAAKSVLNAVLIFQAPKQAAISASGFVIG